MVWEIALGFVADHSESLAIVVFGLYVAYEIRLGKIKSVEENNRVIAVSLYRVIENIDDLDERRFRELYWDNGGTDLLASDLSVEEPNEREVD